MTLDAWIAIGILLLAVLLFVSERLPVDIVALTILVLLLVTRLITPEQGLAGFASEATATVGAMFVLSAGLQRTGALRFFADAVVRFGTTTARMLMLVLLCTAVASAFVNNTAIVAVLLPPVLRASSRRNVPAGRLLIPLSYASQMGGVCTLLGTSTNLLVDAEARRAGIGGFGMFELAPLGLVSVLVGFLYLVVVGRWIPDRKVKGVAEAYQLTKFMAELRVSGDSTLIGRSVEDARLGERGIYALELIRADEKIWSPRAQQLAEGDILLVRGSFEDIEEVRERENLEYEPERRLSDSTLVDEQHSLVEALVAPQSAFEGRTLTELDLSSRTRAIVLAIHRRGQVVRDELRSVRLRQGDVLLLHIPQSEVDALASGSDLLVLNEKDDPRPSRRQAPLALGIVAGVVAMSALGGVPIVVAALAGTLLMLLSGCVRTLDLYHVIDWRVVFLLAGLLPLGTALTESGAAGALADAVVAGLGAYGPIVALAAIYLLTAVLTEFMSNNASALLLVPVALSVAAGMDVSPRPFLVAVAFAASTSFATPIGYQTNAMVYSAGGYRFTDFVRIGVPLNLVFWALATLLIPLLWPFEKPAVAP